jgi:hypothetical protein
MCDIKAFPGFGAQAQRLKRFGRETYVAVGRFSVVALAVTGNGQVPALATESSDFGDADEG